MDAISGRKTFQEIAADHAIHPIQLSQWKQQLLDGASELFTKVSKSKDKEEVQAKEAELFEQYCFSSRRLRLRRSPTTTASSKWSWNGSKKISTALTPMNDASSSIKTSLSSASADSAFC